MNNYDDNYTIFLYQTSSINTWKNKLKEYLSNKEKRKMNLYIVSKNWLDLYEGKSFYLHNNFSQLKEEFLKKKPIYSLPTIFVLDKDYGQEEKYIVEGKFYNHILLIEINKYTKIKLFSFFYLSQNTRLFEGYLEIKQLDKEKDILQDLINSGPDDLKKKYKQIISLKEKYFNASGKILITSDIFNMVLFEYEKPKEENKSKKANNVNQKDNHQNLYNASNDKYDQVNEKKIISKKNPSEKEYYQKQKSKFKFN